MPCHPVCAVCKTIRSTNREPAVLVVTMREHKKFSSQLVHALFPSNHYNTVVLLRLYDIQRSLWSPRQPNWLDCCAVAIVGKLLFCSTTQHNLRILFRRTRRQKCQSPSSHPRHQHKIRRTISANHLSFVFIFTFIVTDWKWRLCLRNYFEKHRIGFTVQKLQHWIMYCMVLLTLAQLTLFMWCFRFRSFSLFLIAALWRFYFLKTQHSENRQSKSKCYNIFRFSSSNETFQHILAIFVVCSLQFQFSTEYILHVQFVRFSECCGECLCLCVKPHEIIFNHIYSNFELGTNTLWMAGRVVSC